MITIDTQFATPSATRFRMPALLEVSAAFVADRRMAVGTSHTYGVCVPAFLNGVSSGVPVWSPPVLE